LNFLKSQLVFEKDRISDRNKWPNRWPNQWLNQWQWPN